MFGVELLSTSCNCPQVHLWWIGNIGSSNGLVPSGTKPLPEPMLTQIDGAMWRPCSLDTRQQCVKRLSCLLLKRKMIVNIVIEGNWCTCSFFEDWHCEGRVCMCVLINRNTLNHISIHLNHIGIHSNHIGIHSLCQEIQSCSPPQCDHDPRLNPAKCMGTPSGGLNQLVLTWQCGDPFSNLNYTPCRVCNNENMVNFAEQLACYWTCCRYI